MSVIISLFLLGVVIMCFKSEFKERKDRIKQLIDSAHELAAARHSNDLLTRYNNWFATLDCDVYQELSEFERRAIEHERLTIVEMLKANRNCDAIIERRLRRVKEQRRSRN